MKLELELPLALAIPSRLAPTRFNLTARRLLSIPLANGRRATVPIDHVRVRYVGQVPL